MKILVFGPTDRYQVYKPDYVADLPLETVFRRPDQSYIQAAQENQDAEILFVDAITNIGADIMDALPHLKMIHSEGVGYNCIDCAAARERGIYVCNNQGCNADSVAEHTIMLMLMALRHGITGHNAVREGRQFQMKQIVMASRAPELGLSTVGIVGLGDIGQATARRLAPFGCKLYYYSLHRRSQQLEEELGITYLPLDELVQVCDILSLHAAVNDQTRGMINAELIAKMRPGLVLVNTARGDLLDNLAVRQALIDGQIGAIAMDTIAPEPTPADHPLVALPPEVQDRAVYSPHLGGNTGGAFSRAHANMWHNAHLLLEGQRLERIVNGL